MGTKEYSSLKEGSFVVVEYEEELFPGVILKKKANGAEVKCMQRAGKYWKWPTSSDIMFYWKKDIVMKILSVQKVGKARFSIPELKSRWQ
jgi:hypothetical protein